MKYFKKRRMTEEKQAFGAQAFADNDPLTGIANLFDLGVVFIVGLILTIFSTYHLYKLEDGAVVYVPDN